MKTHFLALLALILTIGPEVSGSEFTELTSRLGPLRTVSGLLKPSGTLTDQNDWVPAFEGASATLIKLSNPHISAADALGNIYVADKASHSILKITPDGKVHTWVGTHVQGFNGDGPALGTTFQLDRPNGLYVFPDGTLYVYDPGNQRICRCTPEGVVSTVFHDNDTYWGPSGRGLWVSPSQDLIYYTMEVANLALPPIPPSTSHPVFGGVVKKWTPSGGIVDVTRYDHANPTTAGLDLRNPGNIAVHPLTGKLYVTDRAEDDPASSRVWRIEDNGSLTTVAGNGNLVTGYVEGLPATQTALDQVRGIAFFPDGSYLLATHKGGDIVFVDTTGITHLLVAGKGSKDVFTGEGFSTPITSFDVISQPRAVTITPGGSVLITSNDSGFVRILPNLSAPQLPAQTFGQLPAGGEWKLMWTSLPGRSYLIESTPALTPTAQWTLRQVVTPAGTLGEFLETLSPMPAQQFYRIAPPRL